MPNNAFGGEGMTSAVACAIAAARALQSIQLWVEQLSQQEQEEVTRRLVVRNEMYARTLWIDQCCKAARKD